MGSSWIGIKLFVVLNLRLTSFIQFLTSWMSTAPPLSTLDRLYRYLLLIQIRLSFGLKLTCILIFVYVLSFQQQYL